MRNFLFHLIFNRKQSITNKIILSSYFFIYFKMKIFNIYLNFKIIYLLYTIASIYQNNNNEQVNFFL